MTGMLRTARHEGEIDKLTLRRLTGQHPAVLRTWLLSLSSSVHRASLTFSQLAHRTGRHKESIRLALQPLLANGSIARIYPESNHPRQKYVAAPAQRQEISTPP